MISTQKGPLRALDNLYSTIRALLLLPFEWMFLLIYRLVMRVFDLTLAAVSRRRELACDAAAVRAGYGEGLRVALEDLQSIEALMKQQKKASIAERAMASHPPTAVRLEAIREASVSGW